jgi:N-acetylneuraminic acid mutarotase
MMKDRRRNGGLSRVSIRKAVHLTLLLSTLILANGPFSQAQGLWTWKSGSSQVPSSGRGNAGVFGTINVASASNVPGSKLDATTWTDHAGHLWLFGGGGPDANSYAGLMNDLWEFDPGTAEWTWRSGSATIPPPRDCVPGVYGTLGTAAPGNQPGGRTGVASWEDTAGNLWLFGGGGCDSTGVEVNLNDLWKWDVSSHQWTWMGGPSSQGTGGATPGVYGTKRVSASGSWPGSRDWAITWTDAQGTFWLFGGYGASSTSQADYLNDLWSYDPAKGVWTWVSGSNTDPGIGPMPVFGTKGTPDAANVPGAREDSASWVDANGNLWLFGGFGNATSYQGKLNDLWEFQTGSSEWVWMGGSSTPAQPTGALGVYGPLGIPSSSNVPGARAGAVTWTDSNGHLVLFGGQGIDAAGAMGELNDVWEFDPGTGQWAWYGGSKTMPSAGKSPAGNYGTINVTAASNTPGGRDGASAWVGLDGNLWLFGGDGADMNSVVGALNDLWSFEPPTTTPVFSLAAGTYLGAQTLTITDTTQNAKIYYTTDGTAPSTSSQVYSGSLTINKSETVRAIAIASSYTGSAEFSATYTINYLTPAISLNAASTAFVSNAVTLTATLSGNGGTPNGTVTFLDGAASIGTGALANGVATFSTSSLSAGAHSITASYAGGTLFTAATSSAVSVNIVDFTMGASNGSPTSTTVTRGSTATFKLSVTPPSGTTTPTAVTFALTSLPSGMSAAFSPMTVPAGSGATDVTLSISVPSDFSLAYNRTTNAMPVAFGFLLLPLLGIGAARKKLRSKLMLALVLAPGGAAVTASGCGGGGSSSVPTNPTPTSKTYNLVVTAKAGNLVHSTNLTLTVQ